MFKLSDLFLLLAVIISFIISAFFMFHGNYLESIFTAIWVPSILVFGIFFKMLGISALLKDQKNTCCCCCKQQECCKNKNLENHDN